MANKSASLGLAGAAAPDPMTRIDGSPVQPAAVPSRHGLSVRAAMHAAFERVATLLHLWRRRLAESSELRSLSDQELRDFGINRYEAEHAARQAFWRDYRGGI